MKQTLLTLSLLLMLSLALTGQESLETFRDRIQGYYHIIGKPEVKNFSCQLTSDFYVEYIRDKADSSYYYPLKLVWTADKGSFFIRHSLPPAVAGNDTLRQQSLMLMQEIKNILKVIFPDWEIYSIRPPLWDIPADAIAEFGSDTVSISFRGSDKDLVYRVRETYTIGGELGRFIWESAHQKVVNFPLYDEIAGKWACMGWKNQVYQDGFITSGMEVRLTLGVAGKTIVPMEFHIQAQARKSPGGEITPNALTLYMKDFAFNENYEVVEEGAGAPAAPPDGGGKQD